MDKQWRDIKVAVLLKICYESILDLYQNGQWTFLWKLNDGSTQKNRKISGDFDLDITFTTPFLNVSF